MTGLNHITGGLVFTGIFCSFWDVNVFGSVGLFTAALVAVGLPDIDTPRATSGKMVYPLAVWLERHFGHRTITHSLLFLSVVVTLAGVLGWLLDGDGTPWALVFGFGMLSHLILDMVTIQGVPLLYPWFRNACVIPGHPELRLRSGDWKPEVIAFFLFLLIGVSCKDLYANGFWTALNRSFADVKHLENEFRHSDGALLNVEYDLSRNEKSLKGSGWLVDCTPKKAWIFDGSHLVVVDEEDPSLVINAVKPSKSPKTYKIHESAFFGISLDSLNRLLKSKVVTGTIQASLPVEWVQAGLSKSGRDIQLDHEFGFSIRKAISDPQTDLKNNLESKKLQLAEVRDANAHLAWLKSQAQGRLSKAQNAFKNGDDWEREKAVGEIKKAKDEVQSLSERRPAETLQLEGEIRQIENQLQGKNEAQFSGFIRYPII